jgi:hypothetical protein
MTKKKTTVKAHPRKGTKGVKSHTRTYKSGMKKVKHSSPDDDVLQAQRNLIFNMVRNKKNWKLSTKPFRAETETQRDMAMDALSHFTGGAESKKNPDGSYTVTSKGYYHYIGA